MKYLFPRKEQGEWQRKEERKEGKEERMIERHGKVHAILLDGRWSARSFMPRARARTSGRIFEKTMGEEKERSEECVKHTWIYLLTLAILAHCTAPLCQRTMFCRPPRSHQSEVEEKQLELSLLWKGKKKRRCSTRKRHGVAEASLRCSEGQL